MTIKDTVYDRIKNLNPCIFKIRDKYYYIGITLFRECTDEEITDYNKFRNCLKYVEENKKTAPLTEQKNTLKELFKKLMYREDFEYNYEIHEKCKKQLKELLYTLTIEELEDILSQKNDIEKANNYYIGAKHRTDD